MQIDLVQFLFLCTCICVQIHTVGAFHLKSTELPMSSTPEMKQEQRVKVLGVCGGIGQGKSTACKILADLGCIAHLDADSIAHSVYSPGSQAVKDVVSEFGSGILAEGTDDTIDRKELGKIVFAERSAMARLEKIVWPHVKILLSEKIEALRQDFEMKNKDDKVAVIVLEAAILLDAGWDDLLDGIWAVRSPKSTAVKRLVETRNLTEEEAEKRINYQLSSRGIGNIDEEAKNRVITAVIDNNGSLEDLKGKIENELGSFLCRFQ